MKTLTLKIKIGDEEELAPFIFDSDLIGETKPSKPIIIKYLIN